MKDLLIFAGTTEGRKLSEYLAAKGVRHTVCVATEYGELVLKPHALVKVHQGRMNQEQIAACLKSGDTCNFAAVIDATHPFAQDITQNIREALKGSDIPYFRLKRDCAVQRKKAGGGQLFYYGTNEACAEALEQIEGNILLTTGSKELSKYCVSPHVKRRLYVRVLPSVESLSLCAEQGICGRQIIAMQGSFTTEMNAAILRQYHISCLVTKESGISGGYLEKLAAAEETGVLVCVIGCPKEEEGCSFSEVCAELEKLCGGESVNQENRENKLEITLAGAGMGDVESMTAQVQSAVGKADILMGAERLLRSLQDCSVTVDTGGRTNHLQLKAGVELYPFYQAEKIILYLGAVQGQSVQKQKVVVLFSGDSGFYSGCQTLYNALNRAIREKQLDASVRILPGISSVAYLSACVGERYDGAAVYSIHGKKRSNLAQRIKRNSRTFLLTSGVGDVNWLGKQLTDAGMSECRIVVGYQLSYAEQQIREYTPAACCELREEGLYTCLVKNPDAEEKGGKRLTPGFCDGSFTRAQGRIPMTKEEVREVSICKLHLHERAVVYDIGSGTGSVAVEIAGLSDDIQVYAVEQRSEAVSLIEKNKEKFMLQNISVIEVSAPDGLSALPAATHAFIGGSGGKLKQILAVLQQLNPCMRIVINAVSMETICEIKEVLETYPVKEEEIVQLQANRVRQVGSYHMMQAENPVWICSFTFCGQQSSIVKE